MTEKLKEQVTRTLQDEGEAQAVNGDANGDVDMTSPHPTNEIVVKLEPETEHDSSVISPDESETLPPIPAVFRIADLKREVEAIKDRRKMIRVGPSGSGASAGFGVLPSVVAFTLFDHGENANSVEFSRDSSLMAVGSSESCVRLWSLKGDKLKKKAVDMEGTLVEDEGLPMRKLIGHSGPVYSLSFDPLYGSAGPPSTLLSSSQDGSIRLWSLDTYSNLVVYRGHGKDPVWDVEWGPMGVYFASASRDRTARLWSSDRVAPLRMYTGHLSDVNVGLEFYLSFILLKHVANGLLTPGQLVRQIPSQFALPCHSVYRHLVSIMGCPTRCLRASLPRTYGQRHNALHLPGWQDARVGRAGLVYLALGLGLRPADQEDGGSHGLGDESKFLG